MPEQRKIQVSKVNDPASLEKVFAIRREVFVGEQNCPPELEWEFEDESTHFLATVDGEPAGASRWRKRYLLICLLMRNMYTCMPKYRL
jgi:hypothetical protein